MEKKAIAIIPARYASQRLPGKPLLEIEGKSLIQHVYDNAMKCKTLSRVIIATDDERILSKCQEFGAEAIMTPAELASGTDRLAFVVEKLNLDDDIILNIQGDEPLLEAETIDNLINTFSKSGADVGTLIKKIEDKEELFNPNAVKVVCDKNNFALYFSRSTIPYIRDQKEENWLKLNSFWKHIGVYAYRKSALKRFSELEQSHLESLEKLEQLRLLEDGARYLCIETDMKMLGVDTVEDLEKVREYFKENK